MRLVTETIYGSGNDCASCSGDGSDRVLAQVQHLGNGKSRVTEYKYDWRGRQTHTFNDVDENGNYTYNVRKYDNLDRVVVEETWLGQDSAS